MKALMTIGVLAMVTGAAPPPALHVVGAPTPLALSAADLAVMPRGAAVLTAHGASAQCEGVWLRDVLARAGVPAGEAARGPALQTMIVAQARDGYSIAFSLGEIDATLGNGKLLVADRCDGKPLADGDGPVRIVAAGEKRGARSVRALERLVVTPVGLAKAHTQH